jgi:hypothetical protein
MAIMGQHFRALNFVSIVVSLLQGTVETLAEHSGKLAAPGVLKRPELVEFRYELRREQKALGRAD